MVDNFGDLTYVHLMRTTRKKDTLSGKTTFEKWDATFGVKIKINHTENGKKSKQPFRSAVEDSNQTITFCGVGSHH